MIDKESLPPILPVRFGSPVEIIEFLAVIVPDLEPGLMLLRVLLPFYLNKSLFENKFEFEVAERV